MNNEILRKLYGEYVKGVEREAKKGAVLAPLSYAEWSSDFQFSLAETPKTGKEYSMTELRKVNKTMINTNKDQLSRKQSRAVEANLLGGDWRNELTAEEVALVEEQLRNSGYYEALNSGRVRQWMAFHGTEFSSFLEDLGLQSWHMFFNS